MLQRLAIITLCGALGSAARALVSIGAASLLGPRFPAGTLTVNLVGCFAAGIFLHFSLTPDRLSDNTRAAILTGFLGGFTTFSAFAFESLSLWRDKHYALFSANIAANVVLSLAAAFLAMALARWLWP